jgi:hypothetical protein
MSQREQKSRDAAHPGPCDANQMDAHFTREKDIREDLTGVH